MAFSLIKNQKNGGFTFIELLIVITIMGILIATIAFSITEMIKRGKEARAKGDTASLAKAILQMSLDTGQYPEHYQVSDCYLSAATGNHVELDMSQIVGLADTDGLFPNWRGPYIEHVPVDPWGNPYVLDQDYDCDIDTNKHCESFAEFADGQGVVHSIAIYSRGENRSPFDGTGPTVYDSDNIVTILCAE